MQSKTNLFNMALGLMGSGAVLTSDAEKTLETVQMNIFYDTARQTVLRDFPYSFAQRRKNLAQVEKPVEYMEYDYAYALTFKMLRINKILDEHGFLIDMPAIDCNIDKYRIVNTDTSLILLTNLSPCIIEYTEDIDNLDRADASFIEMLAYKLAALVCVPLLKTDSSKVNELNQLYALKLGQSMQNDASTRKLPSKKDSWIQTLKNN